MTTTRQQFPCSNRGAVLHGRQRLRKFLLLLALLCFAVGIAAWFARAVPALLAIGAGALALYARRMSADLDPLWLEIEGARLAVQMRRQRHPLDLAGVSARRLSSDEIEHITRLATTASVTAGTGGFDSHLLGEIDLYATDLDHAVLLQHEETATVVTPDDPAAFLAAVDAASQAIGRPEV
jgi:hypothetical protein